MALNSSNAVRELLPAWRHPSFAMQSIRYRYSSAASRQKRALRMPTHAEIATTSRPIFMPWGVLRDQRCRGTGRGLGLHGSRARGSAPCARAPGRPATHPFDACRLIAVGCCRMKRSKRESGVVGPSTRGTSFSSVDPQSGLSLGEIDQTFDELCFVEEPPVCLIGSTNEATAVCCYVRRGPAPLNPPMRPVRGRKFARPKCSPPAQDQSVCFFFL